MRPVEVDVKQLVARDVDERVLVVAAVELDDGSGPEELVSAGEVEVYVVRPHLDRSGPDRGFSDGEVGHGRQPTGGAPTDAGDSTPTTAEEQSA
jgi:hypothetical protein